MHPEPSPDHCAAPASPPTPVCESLTPAASDNPPPAGAEAKKSVRRARSRSPRIGQRIAQAGQFKGFLMLMRGELSESLMKDPPAFMLLLLIAWRAWRGEGANLQGLTYGQAQVGDHDAIGLSRQQYRSAQARLDKWGLATFAGTRRGSVATLQNAKVFSLGATDEHETQKFNQPANHQLSLGDSQEPTNEPAITQPSANHQPTTNEIGRAIISEDTKTVAPADAGADSTEQWLVGLAAGAAYQGIDVRREFERMVIWCRANRKHPTRRRFLNWLNRCDRPIPGSRTTELPARDYTNPFSK